MNTARVVPYVEVFVAGRLCNPLNARKGWKAVWDYSRRARAAALEMLAWIDRRSLTELREPRPKQILFTANVGAEWDDDNLRAALKPHRDALKDAGIITDDKPSAGNEFVYKQRVDRRRPGVFIRVSFRASIRRPESSTA